MGSREIDTASIRPNPYQPRERFDEEQLNELTESIREVGILQPVLVRPVGDEFELIAGERRWRAARRLGIGRMPALVRESDDVAALEQALVENVHRADLNALEEAAAYQQLIEDFSLTHEAVATRVGRSRTAVTNTLRLLQLPPSVQRQVRDGALSMGHARALLGTPDRALQERLAAQAVKDGWSVRAIEQAVREPAPAEAGRSAGGRRIGCDQGVAATGARGARGSARRPPRHPGGDRDGCQARQGHDRVLGPRGPRADLQDHLRLSPPDAARISPSGPRPAPPRTRAGCRR